jgi:glycosyltransferase involved in cell wall biosynthesis
VDDGSSDRTLAVAQTFASAEVKVVTQKNAGASAARNHALRLSQGDYVQWLDADDLMSPDKIAMQMAVVEKNPDKRVLYSTGWGRFMFRVHAAESNPNELWADLTAREWLTYKLERNLFLPVSSWLVSRELCDAAGPWNESLSLDDDGEYFCRVIMASSRIQFVPGVKFFYRMSGFGSMSNVHPSDKKLESLWLSQRLQIGYLRSLEDNERTRAAGVTYLANWLLYYYPWRMDLIAAAQKLAAELGGKLELPPVRSKYAMIEKLFGYRTATRAQATLPDCKAAVVRAADWMLYKLGR